MVAFLVSLHTESDLVWACYCCRVYSLPDSLWTASSEDGGLSSFGGVLFKTL